MDLSSNNEENQDKAYLFFGKYRILKRIGCGSFGNVYKGINIIDKKNVAIKVEKKDSGYNLLQKESYYLYNLKGIGVPELISYGYSGKYNVLIQTLLGESLGKIFFKNSNRFSLKDICMFSIQILHRIEFVHSKYLIHRDIKPENFLIGAPDEYMIYIIDFGLSKKYKSSRTNKHIQFKLTKKFTGTARYASINAVRGAEQSRRDDLEAIGYMLLFFFNGGRLPWQGVSCKEKAQKYAKIYHMKKNLNYDEFCKNMPREIITYMSYCKELQFEKEPNYEYLRNLFEEVLKKNHFENDLKFSWIKDYSILKNIDEIKLKIFPNNSMSKKKQSPRSRIYKKLESSREFNKDNENQESNTNFKLLISNNSQNNLFHKNNPIIKAKTFNNKYNLGHKRFNSSYDAGLILKGKESDMLKSSIAKYNSSIDDEEAINNAYNNNNYLNLSNNANRVLNRDSSKNNLFYFSNFNDLSKSFALKNNNNENTLSMNIIKTDNDNTNATNHSNIIKKNFTSFIKNDNNIINNTNNNIVINNKIINNKNINNKQNKNNNHSPNIVKSLSYVKKYKNKIDEIKINFKKNEKYVKIIHNINPLTNNENKMNLITKNKSMNIIYNKKSKTNRKINEVKKLNINNNMIINPIFVNKSKNIDSYKIKIKKQGTNIPKNKNVKLIKPKNQNIDIQISPTNINSRSFNLLKKASNNNTHQNQEYIINPNRPKITKISNTKKENIRSHHLSTNLSNNVEGKINKIKTMVIHNSNMKKENIAKNKKINTDIFYKENNNDIINMNQKRINKYKNLRHKMGVKSNNLTLTQNDNNNITKTIPKYHIINKTINSTINNSNTITNTINSNNNNNTIISIYNNYNINNKNNSSNEIYKTHNGINFDLDTLNNNKNKNLNNNSIYFSYNGHKVNSYQNYMHLNNRKSPMMVNRQKINKIVSFPSMLPKFNYENNNTKNSNGYNSQIINNTNEYSYQDDEPKDNLRNYFSINGNKSINEHKNNIPMNLSSVRLNLNSMKIKKILSDIKYNGPRDNIMKKNKKKFANSNTNIFDSQTNKKIFNKIQCTLDSNNINRNNSYQYGRKINYKNIIMNKNNKQKMDFDYYYPTINRKKTDIFYQKLPEFKMNFDIDDSYLVQENRNNTPSFRRHEQNRDIFNKYLKENKFVSLKL